MAKVLVFTPRESCTISRKSPFSGKVNEMVIPMSQESFDQQYRLWRTGNALIQDAFPNLTADQREFIKTGITPEEWSEMFDKLD